jgi:hypothetical protein
MTMELKGRPSSSSYLRSLPRVRQAFFTYPVLPTPQHIITRMGLQHLHYRLFYLWIQSSPDPGPHLRLQSSAERLGCFDTSRGWFMHQ